MESLHTENKIFKQNKRLYVTEFLKHKKVQNSFKKSSCLDEDPNKLFETFKKSDLHQVADDDHFTPCSDDELAKLTPDF